MRLTHKLGNEYDIINDNRVRDFKKDYQHVTNKLGQLEDVEEELGVDITTLLKALKDGIFMNSPFDVVFCRYPKLVCYKNGWRLMANGSAFSLNNYGKYWALTKEELL